MSSHHRHVSSEPLSIALEHNSWATREVLRACAVLDDSQWHRRFEMGPGSLHDTLTHIVGAMFRWADRIDGPPRVVRPSIEDGTRRTPAELMTLLDGAAAAAALAAVAAAAMAGLVAALSTSSLVASATAEMLGCLLWWWIWWLRPWRRRRRGRRRQWRPLSLLLLRWAVSAAVAVLPLSLLRMDVLPSSPTLPFFPNLLPLLPLHPRPNSLSVLSLFSYTCLYLSLCASSRSPSPR